MTTCDAEMCPMWNGDTCVCAAMDGDPDAIQELTDWINDFEVVGGVVRTRAATTSSRRSGRRSNVASNGSAISVGGTPVAANPAVRATEEPATRTVRKRRRTFRGHSAVQHGPADWRCRCGVPLSGGPCGSGRRGARDMLRFHHLDLEMKATTGEWSALPPNVARKLLVTDAGCWEWQGYRTGRGYGQVAINGKERWTVHRLVYTRLVGPVAEGLELDHLCRNRACANPSHLEAVTHAENVRRGDSPSAIAWRKRREEHADVA